jgi:hypothetical protein
MQLNLINFSPSWHLNLEQQNFNVNTHLCEDIDHFHVKSYLVVLNIFSSEFRDDLGRADKLKLL